MSTLQKAPDEMICPRCNANERHLIDDESPPRMAEWCLDCLEAPDDLPVIGDLIHFFDNARVKWVGAVVDFIHDTRGERFAAVAIPSQWQPALVRPSWAIVDVRGWWHKEREA